MFLQIMYLLVSFLFNYISIWKYADISVGFLFKEKERGGFYSRERFLNVILYWDDVMSVFIIIFWKCVF